MIFKSVKNGPLVWPTIEENGVTKPRENSELSHAEAIQADCDVKATNIILQGLPPEVYALLVKPTIWMHMTDYDELNTAKVALMANLSHYGSDVLAEKAQQLEPKLYDGNVIMNTYAITIPDSEETLMLAEESHPSPSCTPTKVAVPKELPKSVEISDLNANLHEQGLIIAAQKDELRKLKGKALVDNVVTTHTIAPEMLKIDVAPLAPRLLNNKTSHSDYLRITQEQAVILREVVEQGKSQNPLNNSLDSALPPRKPTVLETDTSKPEVRLVYSKKPRKSKTNVTVIKLKIIKSISANNKKPSKS
nr:hypothetical protein [Tanacetum cinerariifolium]